MITSRLANFKCNFLFLWLFLSLVSFNVVARVHPYETTRLKSTGGAGVGSILLDESAVLNPAPLAFYNTGTIYVQKIDAAYDTESVNGVTTTEDTTKSVMVSDAKGNLKGSLGYFHQIEGNAKRKRISGSVASRVGGNSAMGVAYWHTKDYNDLAENPETEDKYNQVVFGVSHALNQEFSMGVIVIDPLKVKPEDNRFVVGFQYLYREFIALMTDVGSNYNYDLSPNLLYRAAIQFKFYNDFYARIGIFDDKMLMEKGNGIGLSWVGPKLILDGAFKNTSPKGESLSDISYGTKVRELSMSLSYLF
jgi:hypothetical protein